MKCYEDARAGVDRDAVAVCGVCGMGLCLDHVVEREAVPLVTPVSGWASKTAMTIVCSRCAQSGGWAR